MCMLYIVREGWADERMSRSCFDMLMQIER
jgi:hypothetical protein